MVLQTCLNFFNQKDYLIIERIPFIKGNKRSLSSSKMKSGTTWEWEMNDKSYMYYLFKIPLSDSFGFVNSWFKLLLLQNGGKV